MIRLLEGLVLLKEINELDGCAYSSAQLMDMYPKSIVVYRHIKYIYRDVLPEYIAERLTVLDDYIQLGELVEQVSINRNIIRKRIAFMKQTGIHLFDYEMVSGIFFIKLDEEFKYLFQNFQPFLATLQDLNLEHCKLLGDLKIGFY